MPVTSSRLHVAGASAWNPLCRGRCLPTAGGRKIHVDASLVEADDGLA